MSAWRLQPSRTALLVIDAQEKLLPAMFNAEPLTRRLTAAVAVARLFEIAVFHSEQAPEKLGPTVEPVRAALGPDAPAARPKLAFSAGEVFPRADLPPTLLVVGVETHVCVRQTVFDLRAKGRAVRVLADAVGSRAETDHRLALHELREAGARITTLETVAWEMLGSAADPRFKALLAILK